MSPSFGRRVPRSRRPTELGSSFGPLWGIGAEQSREDAKRKVSGVTDAQLEAPMDIEEIQSLNARHKAYGYALDSFEVMWPHVLGRLRRDRFQSLAMRQAGKVRFRSGGWPQPVH